MWNTHHFGERVNVVDEEIALDAALERLDAAHIVVQGLQTRLTLALDIIKSLEEQGKRRDEITAAERAFMARIALRLAGAGSYDHKGKNETLLAVISDLLANSQRPLTRHSFDDLPF